MISHRDTGLLLPGVRELVRQCLPAATEVIVGMDYEGIAIICGAHRRIIPTELLVNSWNADKLDRVFTEIKDIEYTIATYEA